MFGVSKYLEDAYLLRHYAAAEFLVYFLNY